MKTFVVGDIHGAYRALKQCLIRSVFNYERDRLVVLGDVCDGYPEVSQAIDELLKIKHCDLILGNHDAWALEWALSGQAPEIWTSQGGRNTMASYGGGPMPEKHIHFIRQAKPWLEIGKNVFVHGGFDIARPLAEQSAETLLWDRDLLYTAWKRHLFGSNEPLGSYDTIFLGHTPTEVYESKKPLHLCNVWALDTGAGWSGSLTIMDVDSKEYWQSDPTPTLYKTKGRE